VKSRMKSKSRKQKASPQKSFSYSPYFPLEGTLYSGEPDIDIQRGDFASVLAYDTDTAVNRAVGLVSDAVDSMRWRIMGDADGKDSEMASSDDRRPRHPMAQAIHDVFLEQGQPFLALMATSTQLYGETYIAKTINEFDKKRGIRWLNPWWVQPQVISGEIKWYQWGARNGTEWTPIAPQHIAYYHTFNPSDDLRGYSKVDAVLGAINLNRYARRFTKFTFKNNARPGALLTPVVSQAGETILHPKEVNDIAVILRDNHRGTVNANQMMISPRPLQVTVFDQPDLDKYYSLVEIVEREIFRTFGVPLAMAGDSSSSTYKDGEEVFNAFYKNTIIPLCRVIAKFINAHLMPWLDPTGRCTFEFDTSAFEDTAETDKAIADKIAVQLGGSYLTMNEARVAQGLPALPELEGLVLVQGMPTPITRLAQPPAPALLPDITITEPAIPQLSARADNPSGLPLRIKALASGDYCILAPLANTPAIQTVQDTLRGLIKDADWQKPDTFHLTFAYGTGTHEQIAQVAIDGSIQAIIVDSVDQFETDDGYAIHLRVRPTAELLAYQSRLVQQLKASGMDISEFSTTWHPHITLCYATVPITPFTITPIVLAVREVIVSDDAYVAIGSAALKHVHTNTYDFPKPMPVGEWREKALNELKAWQRHEKAGKNRPFIPVYTAHLLDGVYPVGERPVKTAGVTFDILFDLVRHEPFKATLARVERAFTKDIGGTRQEFEDEFLLAIADHKDGAISASQLSSVLNAVVDNLGEQAYRDGLEDGGVAEAELDEDDRDAIARLTRDAKAYIGDFVAAFDTYSDLQLDQRPKLWANKTLQGFYDHGLAAADANGIYVWTLGQTEQHCATCLTMAGQRKRMKRWLKDGILPKSDKLDCGGWNCDCGLENVRGGARG
jgi:HK97 family phage portal protein